MRRRQKGGILHKSRRPIANDHLFIESRQSDTNFTIGTALVDGITFCGWINLIPNPTGYRIVDPDA